MADDVLLFIGEVLVGRGDVRFAAAEALIGERRGGRGGSGCYLWRTDEACKVGSGLFVFGVKKKLG